MQDERLFQKACLVQLSTSCWQGRTVLQSSLLEQIGNSGWLRGSKVLVDPESLAFIRSAVTKARVTLQKLALPFPIKGLTLLPKDSVGRIDRELSEIRDEFYAEVEIFLSKYHDERERAKESLGSLFDPSDYPVDVRAKFRFEWRFLVLDLPGKSKILSPEIYEREKAKFQSMMEETRDLATLALREEFAEIVRHISDRLTGKEDGKPKQIRSAMMDRLHEFLDSFGDRNLFQDGELASLVTKAREMVDGVSVEGLRADEGIRQRLGDEMISIRDAVDAAIEDLPRRKIRMAA